ncbi:endonuclease/exonuclease/phosphatase family protein [Oscillospiraceae bacterium HV4-5-C5C]|nr:endonuclease/exonuclease/phosphatase family protein [Oscillospiraceae bacterium HV4-5-C5C]
MSLKFVTFNIRCDYGQDGSNNFCFRQPLILAELARQQPDIVAFQEVLPHVAAWLKASLPDYYLIGCPRSATLSDEQVPVAFKKERFNLLQMETFWLSPQPYEPGSRYAVQSTCPRVCTAALFQDLSCGQIFRVLNLHLDHEGSPARELGLRQVLQYLKTVPLLPQAPVLLAGDFNAQPDSPELRLLQQNPDFLNLTEGIGITFHSFSPADPPCSIDYIFLKQGSTAARAGSAALYSPKQLYCSHVSKWETEVDGVWLSDHYPICAELDWQA